MRTVSPRKSSGVRPTRGGEALDFRLVRATAEALEGAAAGPGHHDHHPLRQMASFHMPRTNSGQLVIHLGLTGKLSLLEEAEKDPEYASFALRFEDGRGLMMRDQRHLGKVYVRPFAEIIQKVHRTDER
jgi:formamidopyrimidine-DNA glycosylase